MDPKVLVSIDSLCPGLEQGAVLFWMARLTEYQVDALRKEGSTSIKAIGDNVYSKEKDMIIESTQVKEPISQERSDELGKRTWVALERQTQWDVGLNFLSTSPGHDTVEGGFYTYLAPAGAKVTVYVMSTGLDVQPSEFSPGRVRWIYGLEAEETETDASDPERERYGTCETQKVGGRSYGVAKNCDLVMVKILDNAGAFIDALRLIIDDVVLRGIRAIGKSVVHATACYRPRNDAAGRLMVGAMLPLLNKLMIDLQVVIVVSAGSNREPYKDIDSYPAAFAHVIDIITVGSVIAEQGEDNGKRYSNSQGGDALMVSGPGNGLCVGTGLGHHILQVTGPGIATAAVAGLVAYFLSLPDLGKRLRRNRQTPKNVLDYLQIMSYRRYAAQESVWNGLGQEDAREGYSNWIGVPPPKRYLSLTLPSSLARSESWL